MRPAGLVLVLVAAACSGGGGTNLPTTSGPSTPPSPSTSPSPSGSAAVGSVTDVLLPRAFLDGVKAHQGDDIRASQTLSTDDGGAADFSLNQKISSCRLLESSAV